MAALLARALVAAACLAVARGQGGLLGFLTGTTVPNEEPQEAFKTHVDNGIDALLVHVNNVVSLADQSAGDAKQAVYEHAGGDIARHFPSHGTIKVRQRRKGSRAAGALHPAFPAPSDRPWPSRACVAVQDTLFGLLSPTVKRSSFYSCGPQAPKSSLGKSCGLH